MTRQTMATYGKLWQIMANYGNANYGKANYGKAMLVGELMIHFMNKTSTFSWVLMNIIQFIYY